MNEHAGLHGRARIPKRSRRTTTYAVVHRVPEHGSPGLLAIAGRPLLARQLAWLFGMGAGEIIVELGLDDESEAVARWLEQSREYGADVVVVRTDRPLGARAVARCAGAPVDAPLLAIPADLLGDADLAYLRHVGNRFGTLAILRPPAPLARHVDGGTVRLVRAPLGSRGPEILQGSGWGVRVRSALDAQRLGRAWSLLARESASA